MTLADEIKSFLKGDVDASSDTLEKYSRDASLFYIKPSVVVFPKDTEDISRLVDFVNQKKKEGRNISLTARSAGTDMTGGPLTESIVVEMTKYFNQFKELGNSYAVSQPGVFYRDFEKKTLEKGLIMPSYPASRELCTIGGMVANNSGGEKTLQYGKTEKYVEEIKMVLADGKEHSFKKLKAEELEIKMAENSYEGEIYKKLRQLIVNNQALLEAAKPNVTKNSAGYYLWNVWNPAEKTFDINKLITGSQGTFGIITEVRLSLVRMKPKSRLLIIFLNNLNNLGELTERILSFKPESFESYDDNTFRLAIKFFPEILERIKGSFIRIALALAPTIWMLISGHFKLPKLVLLVEFAEDTGAEAYDKARTAAIALKKEFKLKMRVTASEEETQEFWVIRRESFNLLRHHVQGLRTAPFIDDFSVRHQVLPQFLPRLYTILNQYKLLYTIAGHVGDGNFHIIPLMDLGKPSAKETIEKLSREVYDLVFEFKGSTTAEHNDGIIRSSYLKEAFGEKVYELFVETKKIFDPDNIFNPGKKTGSDFKYALDHLDKKM
ncbi:MAG: FAD-binding oxidoreductase [bacterium]|nr:FAD-binding oxidoreductase [bacterium]